MDNTGKNVELHMSKNQSETCRVWEKRSNTLSDAIYAREHNNYNPPRQHNGHFHPIVVTVVLVVLNQKDAALCGLLFNQCTDYRKGQMLLLVPVDELENVYLRTWKWHC